MDLIDTLTGIMGFLLNIVVGTLVSAGVLFLVSRVIRGVEIDGWGAAIVSAVVLALGNKLVWTFFAPILLPLTMLTLGLVVFVINALMLKMTAAVVRGFEVRSFGAALAAALAMFVIHMVVGLLFGI